MPPSYKAGVVTEVCGIPKYKLFEEARGKGRHA
jgi:hypothetical protein